MQDIIAKLETDSKSTGQDQKLTTNKKICNFAIFKLSSWNLVKRTLFWQSFMMISQKFLIFLLVVFFFIFSGFLISLYISQSVPDENWLTWFGNHILQLFRFTWSWTILGYTHGTNTNECPAISNWPSLLLINLDIDKWLWIM